MTVNPADSEIFGDLYGAPEMRALFSDPERLRRMAEVEGALARAEAKLGLIPAEAASAIAAAAAHFEPDMAELAASTRKVGYPVVAVVRALGSAAGPEAARFVHWGATTQDILDTALVLQIRRGLELIEADLVAIVTALAAKAGTYRLTPMAGRTHLQHALPITFGYKCAVWLVPFLHHLERLREIRHRVLTVQFGGAVGTLAALGEHGPAVVAGLAVELGLAAPEISWHVNRDGVAEVACFLGLVCGSLSKIATDIVLLMQTEVGEVFEPHEAGRGGSSTMPQKRNPIAAEYVLASARGVHALVPLMLGAMAQDHERATGPWQAEALALPQSFVLTAGALAQARTIVEGMTVDAARMRRNLDLTGGLISAEAVMVALAERIGRPAAHHTVEQACNTALASGRSLAAVLAEIPEVAAHFDAAALDRLTDPARQVGAASALIDQVLRRVGTSLGQTERRLAHN